MAKISSQLQENIFQSRLKPGLTASRMSLKHLSKFRDKLNYENEDYERKLIMDKNSHFDQNFQQKEKNYHFEGSALIPNNDGSLPDIRRHDGSPKIIKKINQLKQENYDLPDQKVFNKFEMKYSGTLNDLLGSSNFIPSKHVPETAEQSSNRNNSARRKQWSAEAERQVEQAGTKEELMQQLVENAKEKRKEMIKENEVQQQIDGKLRAIQA